MNVSVNPNMITTAFELPGYRVVKTMGLVRGVTVRSRSILGTIGASLETLVGGNITLFEEMCEKSGVAMYRTDQHGRCSCLRSTRTNAHPPCRYFRQLSIRPARRRTT